MESELPVLADAINTISALSNVFGNEFQFHLCLLGNLHSGLVRHIVHKQAGVTHIHTVGRSVTAVKVLT